MLKDCTPTGRGGWVTMHLQEIRKEAGEAEYQRCAHSRTTDAADHKVVVFAQDFALSTARMW